jgi:hypothetical protein
VDRRVAGIGLLVVVIAAALVLSTLIRPGLPGTASVSPLPAPPSPGSCIRAEGSEQVVVDCSEPHTGEVSAAWSNWAPEVADKDQDGLRLICRAAGADYLGVSVAEWTSWPAASPATSSYAGSTRRGFALPELGETWSPVPVLVGTSVVGGPTWQDPLGYRACTVRIRDLTAEPPYSAASVTAPVAEILAATPRPDFLRLCYNGRPQEVTSCTAIHTGEVLAMSTVTIPATPGAADPVDDDARYQTCVRLAADATGSTDPTFGKRLMVGVRGESSSPGLTDVGGAIVSERTVRMWCTVEAVGDHWLTGSVIGVGSAGPSLCPDVGRYCR